MIRRVRVLPAARLDLGRLAAFLREKSPGAAESAAQEISQAIASLDQFAERGRQGPQHGVRELVVRFGHDAYVIRYRVEPSDVIVARIFHSREYRR